MASQKQQQQTILRLIRENEHLHKELLRARERARLHGTKILHEAMLIIDDNRMEKSERRQQFVDSYLDQLHGGKSPARDKSTRQHYSPQVQSGSFPNQSRSTARNTDSQWIKENRDQSFYGNTDINGNYRPRKESSRWEPDESGSSAGGPSSLHESMLRSMGNSTSKWVTQSSYEKDSLAQNLFPDDRSRRLSATEGDRLRKVSVIEDSQIRPKTTTQHVSIDDDGVITQEVFKKDDSTSPITTKLLLGDHGIEIVRMQSPQQSDEGITVGSHQFKSAETSKLIQSPLAERSRSTAESPIKQQDESEKRGSVATTQLPNYTVWDIPNDNFSGHKLSKTTFYGVPVDTSTPIRREEMPPAKEERKMSINKDTAYESSQQASSASKIPYTSSQLTEQQITNESVQEASDAALHTSKLYDHALRRPSKQSESAERLKETKDKEEDAAILSAPETEEKKSSYDAPATPRTVKKMTMQAKDLDLTNLLQNIQLSKRLLGEIAFQLDRRVINYVFSGKHDKRQRKRLYGYCVQNIEAMIRRHAIDHKTGQIDAERLHGLERRYNYILNSLRPLGYNIEYHADFSMDMVNKYGLLPLRPGPSSTSTLNPSDNSSLHKLVASLAAPHEVKDMTILVDSLALLARDDGKPMVYW